EACKGTAKKIEIHHVKSGEGPQAYLKYELTNGLLSNYSVSSDGESPPFESLSLNFTKIEMNYIDYDSTTKQSKPIPAVYDLTQVNKG
ncbi:MAG: Hcp1 family type secretion system effector, partial [Gammaproteobacteria bacterium]|nr:Hcp1 family type secretion system effector [Gammaproteobacteria bacterium]